MKEPSLFRRIARALRRSGTNNKNLRPRRPRTSFRPRQPMSEDLLLGLRVRKILRDAKNFATKADFDKLREEVTQRLSMMEERPRIAVTHNRP